MARDGAFSLAGGDVIQERGQRMNYWLFQANDEYPLTVEIPKRLGKGDYWLAQRYRDKLKEGDKVVFWQSGPSAGIYGLGELTGTPYESPNKDAKNGVEWRIDIGYSRLFDHPIFATELRRHPDLTKLPVFKQPYAANPFPIQVAEWKVIQRFINKKSVNIFSHYKQQEDQFTNGLMSILDLSQCHGGDRSLVHRFLKDVFGISLGQDRCRVRVLRDIEGTADAEIWDNTHCIRIETKIRSGTLRNEQLRDHLKRLKESPARRKALLLITPDDHKSDYISRIMAKPYVQKFVDGSSDHRIEHVEWRVIYKYLEDFAKELELSPTSLLIQQFLEQIYDCIFEQDFAGVIQKISFGDISEVYADQYIKEMRNDEWDRWNTPRKYEKLDGTGRKLLLYDNSLQAITAEAEIQKVYKANESRAFPWTNIFVPKSLQVYETPVPVARVIAIPGFENFKSGRSANWNVTREQYRLLRGVQ